MPPATGDALHHELVIREAVAPVFVSDVDPVIEIPDQATGLVLHVATAVATVVNLDLLVSYAISVGVSVVPQIERVGDVNHHTIVER